MARILVIDDEAPIRANVCRLLRLEGYEVDAAASGTDGLERARLQRPDLVICDIVMAGSDGYAVLAGLREMPATQCVPFVFLTASADPSEREQCLLRGATEYLCKPFRLQELLATVRRCLAEAGG